MKTCTGCGADKPLDQFYEGKSRCKTCVRLYARGQRARYYQANIEACRAYARERSRTRYTSMTPGEREAHNRESWRRWGRPRYLRRRHLCGVDGR